MNHNRRAAVAEDRAFVRAKVTFGAMVLA